MPQFKEESRQIIESPKDWVEGLFSLSDWLKDAISVSPKAVGQLLGGLDKLLRILIAGLLKELWKELITN
jgi:hypothetical protein